MSDKPDESIQMMAQRFNKAWDEGGEQACDAVLFEIFECHGRDVVIAVLEEAQRQKRFAFEQARAEHEQHKREMAEAMHLFAGLPEGTTLREACEIKAAQGDALAQQYLNWLNSREARQHDALVNAAVELHPGWHKEGNVWVRDDPKAPDMLGNGGELVEWLYKNHPDVAKCIEQEIDDAEPKP